MTEPASTLDLTPNRGRHRLTDRLARRAVLARLGGLASAELHLIEDEGSHVFGRDDDLRAHVVVRDPRFWKALLFGGSIGGAEAYMDGWWDTEDLVSVVRVLARNEAALSGLEGGVARLRRPLEAVRHRLRRNSREGSRQNIAAHYDLGNDFFSLFLDPTMTYSSGVFERAEATLEEASHAKYDRLARALRLGPSDHVLEIGTGWGGFAIRAAQTRGCRVTTTTISREQHDAARERIDRAGLGDRITLLFEDYRDLRGRFDKLVSIEMIEAVGMEHLGTFFRTCSDRLAPNGAMGIQAITNREQDWEAAARRVDFIKRYVFPGGQLVSLTGVCEALARETDLRITRFEDITPHYAETLKRWRLQMNRNLEAMRGLGLPDRFLRLWHFYLCYCEGGFRERVIGAGQILFEKPACRWDAAEGVLDG